MLDVDMWTELRRGRSFSAPVSVHGAAEASVAVQVSLSWFSY